MCAAVAVGAGVAASNPVGWVVAGVVVAGVVLACAKKGREWKPIAKRVHCKSRKEAYDRAQRAGGGKKPRGPERHPDVSNHFHPNVPKGHPRYHDHYFFPESQF